MELEATLQDRESSMIKNNAQKPGVQLGLSDADVGGNGHAPPDGGYIVRIEKVIYKPSKKEKTDLFIVEYLIDSIIHQKPTADMSDAKKDMAPAEVGEKCSWVAKTMYAQSAGRIKQFLFAVTGAQTVDEGPSLFADLCKAYDVNAEDYAHIKDPWDKIASLAQSEQNPFNNLTVRVDYSRTLTEKNKVMFPVPEWHSITDTAEAA